MRKAKARHILVQTERQCQQFKDQIENGADFADIARKHSLCPSGRSAAGNLGDFRQGDMVAEFDEVVFSGEVGKIHGPVKTEFGFHLIDITRRDD